MKKIGVLSFLSFIGIAAFAAFPVMESGLVELVLVDNETTNSPLATWSLVLGIIWFPTLLIGALMSWGGPELFWGSFNDSRDGFLYRRYYNRNNIFV